LTPRFAITSALTKGDKNESQKFKANLGFGPDFTGGQPDVADLTP
jgi:hypothetical protein